jgi:hypothetical protein
MTPIEHRRAVLWTSCCEHLAVLPWVGKVITLAQAAEDDTEYCHMLAHRAVLVEQLADIEAQLLALDPVWCEAVMVHDKCVRWTAAAREGTR